MGGLFVHSIGSIDLNTVDLATDDYFVEDFGNPPVQRVTETYVTDGQSAFLATYEEGEAPQTLNIFGLGTDEADAEAKLDALQTLFDQAANGTAVVVYAYQEDPSMVGPKTWTILRGKVQRRWRDVADNQLFGFAGRAIAPAKLIFTLSKS